jgi:glycosyltransferase involved in cell wall biosynthesis
LPSITVVVPVYGQAHYLLENLYALRKQSIFCNQQARRVDVKTQIVVVQDGSINRGLDDVFMTRDTIDERVSTELAKFPSNVSITAINSHKNHGRSTARNVGLHHAVNDVVVFMDCRIILDECALAEVCIRFAKLNREKFVLLGFKENLKPSEHSSLRHLIRSGIRRPEVLSGEAADWKVRRHARKDMSAEQITSFALWNGQKINEDQTINYMGLTNWLRGIKNDETILTRRPGYFLSTALVALDRRQAIDAGGFNTQIQDSWGLEDSFFGAVLCSRGVQMIPCPTFCAFLIDDSFNGTSGEDQKRIQHDRGNDLERNRKTVENLLRRSPKEVSTKQNMQGSLPKEGDDYTVTTWPPALRIDSRPSAPYELPKKPLAFFHNPADTTKFERILLSMMRRAHEQNDLQFKTLTTLPPFFVRPIWEQYARQRNLKQIDSQYQDMFYLLRARYNLWQELAEQGKIQLLFDRDATEKALSGASDDDFWESAQRIEQVRQWRTLMQEFPKMEIRLLLPNQSSGQTYFICDDSVLTYNNRSPKKGMTDAAIRIKGEFYPESDDIAKARGKSFSDLWEIARLSKETNRDGVLSWLSSVETRLSQAKI